MNHPLKNWAGNITYGADVHYPNTVGEVQELVQRCKAIKALGSRHSFNRIADSKENLVSLERMNKVVSLNKVANTVTVEGGMRYGELSPWLHENGYALHNLASLPHITIAGAVATATHGSGVLNGNLATQVAAIEFVNAAGDLVSLSKEDGENFYGAVVGLGAMGIVTKITLHLLPAFNMQQRVYRNLPMKELEKNFTEIVSAGYSVSLFTDWKNKNINSVWIKSRVGEEDSGEVPARFYSAELATENVHPLDGQDAENCTEQMGVEGPWDERTPHFKMGFKPSAGQELQGEYFVPFEHGYEAIMAIEKLHEKISPHLFVSEIRTINADNFWMSPCYRQPCVAIHTTWKQDVDTVMNLLPLMEEQLAPFNARPHWGKIFAMPPQVLQSRYGKLAEFKQLINQYDPAGKFRNEFLDELLYSG